MAKPGYKKGSYGVDRRGNRVSASSPNAVSTGGGSAAPAAPAQAPQNAPGGAPNVQSVPDYLMYGAAGRGGLQPGQKPPESSPGFDPGPQRAGESTDQYKARILGTTLFYDDPSSATGFSNTPVNARQRRSNPTVSPEAAAAVLERYGITGTGAKVTGLTPAQAKAEAERKRQELLGGATLAPANDFFAVTQIGNVKKVSETLRRSLRQAQNDPWSTAEDKRNARERALAAASLEYSRLFSDPNDLVAAFSADAGLQRAMEDFTKAGGDIADVAARVAGVGPGQGNQSVAEYLARQGNPGATVVRDVPNADGTRTVTYGDGTSEVVSETMSPDGATATYRPLGPAATGDVFQDAAAAFMGRDYADTVANIDRLAKVPEKYRAYYYGDEAQAGILARQKAEAKARIDSLEKEAKAAERDAARDDERASARDEAQMELDLAELEEKRVQAKAYLTGRLAEIGALTTTGEAPVALANLDAKYAAARSATRRAYQDRADERRRASRDAVAKVRSGLSEAIAKIQGDLTKSAEEVDKEVLKLSLAAEDKIASAREKYQNEARQVYKTFLDTSNKASRTYIDEFVRAASGGLSPAYAAQLAGARAANAPAKKGTAPKGGVVSGGLTLTAADLASGEQALNSSRGSDGYADTAVYLAAHQKWVDNKGLTKDFVLKFPPKRYLNPSDPTVPAFLSPGAAPKSATGARSLD